MMHYIQSLVVERAVAALEPLRRAEMVSRVQEWLRPGVWPHYQDALLEPLRRERRLITYGKMGSATLRRIEARPMVDHALEVLEAAPQDWFDAAFQEWYQEATGRVLSGSSP